MIQFIALVLVILLSSAGYTAESSKLVVGASGAQLYERQNNQSNVVAVLEKGVELQPLAHAIGTASWYMVKTPQGYIGWVQGSEVVSSNRVAETFKDTSQVNAPSRPKTTLGQCLADADAVFRTAWDNDCRVYRLVPACTLPVQNSDILRRDYRAARSECIALFSPNK